MGGVVPQGAPERESDLMRRFRNGDEEAFRILFERNAGILRQRIERWLPARLRRRLAVSDVLQETRIVAFSRRSDFEVRGEDAFRNWLLGIAEMKMREALRTHAGAAKRAIHREVTRGRRLDTAHFLGRGPSPSQVAISAETERVARRAMERLSDDHREVLRLTREEGLSLRQAADRMGRSPEAVRKLCGRAICRFKAIFDELGGSTRA
jgi:RNA polymerase sigma-70 factor (ECF subfamily)